MADDRARSGVPERDGRAPRHEPAFLKASSAVRHVHAAVTFGALGHDPDPPAGHADDDVGAVLLWVVRAEAGDVVGHLQQLSYYRRRRVVHASDRNRGQMAGIAISLPLLAIGNWARQPVLGRRRA